VSPHTFKFVPAPPHGPLIFFSRVYLADKRRCRTGYIYSSKPATLHRRATVPAIRRFAGSKTESIASVHVPLWPPPHAVACSDDLTTLLISVRQVTELRCQVRRMDVHVELEGQCGQPYVTQCGQPVLLSATRARSHLQKDRRLSPPGHMRAHLGGTYGPSF